MTPAPLPPDLALAYLRALSADLRGAALAAADGTLLAGDADVLADPAATVARDARHVVAVRTGPHAIGRVLALDLDAVLGAS